MLKFLMEKINEVKQKAKEEELATQVFALMETNKVKDLKNIIKTNPQLLLKIFNYNNFRQSMTLLEYALEKNNQNVIIFMLDQLELLIPKEKREDFFNFNHNQQNYGALFMALQNELIFQRLIELGARLNHFDKLNEFCQNQETLDLKGHLEMAFQKTINEKLNHKHFPIKITETLRKNVLSYPQLLEKVQLEQSLPILSKSIPIKSKVKI